MHNRELLPQKKLDKWVFEGYYFDTAVNHTPSWLGKYTWLEHSSNLSVFKVANTDTRINLLAAQIPC